MPARRASLCARRVSRGPSQWETGVLPEPDQRRLLDGEGEPTRRKPAAFLGCAAVRGRRGAGEAVHRQRYPGPGDADSASVLQVGQDRV